MIKKTVALLLIITLISAAIVVYYYGAIRPTAEDSFREDICRGMQALNQSFWPYWINAMMAPQQFVELITNASAHFHDAMNVAKVLLINSTPYSKIATLLKQIAENYRDHPEYMKNVQTTWNQTQDGLPFRTIRDNVLQNCKDTPDNFENMCNTTNWAMLIGFLKKLI